KLESEGSILLDNVELFIGGYGWADTVEVKPTQIPDAGYVSIILTVTGDITLDNSKIYSGYNYDGDIYDIVEADSLSSAVAISSDINLIAIDGSIYLNNGSEIYSYSSARGEIATATSGDINLTAKNDVELGYIGTLSDVNITAITGVIIDNNDGEIEEINIAASNLVLSATQGIGLTEDPLETQILNLQAKNVDSMDINIVNQGPLFLKDLIGLGYAVKNQASNGKINIFTTSFLTVDYLVSADGDIILTSLENSSVDTDYLVVNANITSTSGNIFLQAGDDIIQNDKTTIQTKSLNKKIILIAGDNDEDNFGEIIQDGTAKIITNKGDITLSAKEDIKLTLLDATYASDGGFVSVISDGSLIDNDGGNVPTDYDIIARNARLEPLNSEIDLKLFEVVVATILTVSPVTSIYGENVTLTATLKTENGATMSGRSISFVLNDNSVGEAITNDSGTATLTNVSLLHINAGAYDTAIKASFAGDESYLASIGVAQLTVNKRPITVTAVSDTKIYDGTTASSGIPRIILGSLATGDTATWTQVFFDKNAGTNKTLIPSGTINDGNSGNNYQVTFVNNTEGVINQRDLTVTATGNDKVYDGTIVASVTLLDNRISGDNLTLNYTTATFDDKNVGNNKRVTVDGISISGPDAGNYNLINTTTTTTANITQKNLTVVGITADNKVYDGTTAATINTANASLVGVAIDDNVELDASAAIGVFQDSSVGTNKTVIVSGLKISGADAVNYTLTQPIITADITPPLGQTTLNHLSNIMLFGPLLPTSEQLKDYRFNLFNPLPVGPVYFYHPLTTMDMSAFGEFVLEEGAYEFINKRINIIGHEGLLQFFK
ncbi:MAG: YDG domain-containing protein, partial [Candidatus Omnitrophica bacterium]|nr:YDG domain-containing protein [Candidatus Omnitrophota bacterium]